MKPSRPSRKLSEPLQHRLNAYALAATGAGMLAATQPAEARIIYTAAHQAIGCNHRVVLDLNHDGLNDFTFHETFLTTSSVGEDHALILSVLPTRKANQIFGLNHHASALPAGVRIGPKGRFSYAKKTMAVDYYADGTGGSGTCGGLWNNVKNRYLGFRFTINGTTHFGWARLNVTCITMYGNHQVKGLLTGYAYETIPGRAIITGQTIALEDESAVQPSSHVQSARKPATLGMLATGFPALSLWRRKPSPDDPGNY